MLRGLLGRNLIKLLKRKEGGQLMQGDTGVGMDMEVKDRIRAKMGTEVCLVSLTLRFWMCVLELMM